MKRSSVFIRPGQNGRSTFIVVHKRIVMCLLRTAAVDDVNPCICTTREGGSFVEEIINGAGEKILRKYQPADGERKVTSVFVKDLPQVAQLDFVSARGTQT